MDRKSPASPAVRARRRPAQRTEWRLAILGQTQHRHDGRQRPPALARRLGAGLARRCRRPASLRWRARGGPGCCCPGRSARWPRPPSPSSSFCFCIDARSDNPYFWWSLPSSSPPAMPSRSCTHYRHGCRYADALARTPPPPRPRPAPCSWRRAPPRAAAGTGRHVGHTGRRTGRPGRDRARHGIRVASHVHAGALHAWLAFANRPPPCQRRPARADGGSTPPGHRRPARLVRGSTPPSGRRRACAQRTAAPPLAGAQARTRAPHCPQKLAAGASVARHCTHAAGVSDAPHCAQNRPPAACAAPQRRRQARPGGVEDSGSDHRRIRSGRAGCRVNRSRDGCHGRLPTDASVCPCRTPNRLAALTCA